MSGVGMLIVFAVLGAVICAKSRVAGGAVVFSLIALALFTTTPIGAGLPGDAVRRRVGRRPGVGVADRDGGGGMSAPTHAGRDWRQLAACTSVDPELFFPPIEDRHGIRGSGAAGQGGLQRCPVIATCLDFALGALAHGIAGGLTAEERRVQRAADAQPYLDSAGRLIGAGRDATADVGRAQIAGGRRPAVVGHEFGVSKRTAQRWAARARTTNEGGEPRRQPGSPRDLPQQRPGRDRNGRTRSLDEHA